MARYRAEIGGKLIRGIPMAHKESAADSYHPMIDLTVQEDGFRERLVSVTTHCADDRDLAIDEAARILITLGFTKLED